MNKVRLIDICQPKQWKTIPTSQLTKEGYPVYGANGKIGFYSKYNHEKETILITCRGATCGSLNISEPFSYVNGNAMCLDKLDDSVLLKYLYYNLCGYNFSKVISGTAQPQITGEGLSKVVLNIHSANEQKIIVDLFEKLEKILISQDLYYQKLDELIKSRFVEMFGDPILNPKGWEMTTIGEIVTEVKYGTSRPAIDGGKYAYLRMNNLTYDGYLDLADLKRIDIPDSEIDKCIVRKGDVLFNRTNSIELVGKTCVFDKDEDMIIAGYIIRVRLKPVMLPLIMSYFMNTDALKKKLRSMAKGAVNQANINAQELKAIKIYLPPTDLQQQFADFVAQTDKSKLVVKKQIEKLETLKKSLMQEYFG